MIDVTQSPQCPDAPSLENCKRFAPRGQAPRPGVPGGRCLFPPTFPATLPPSVAGHSGDSGASNQPKQLDQVEQSKTSRS